MVRKVTRAAQERQEKTLVTVTTYNVRTLTVNGENGYGRDE